jgi:phage terminase large subunit
MPTIQIKYSGVYYALTQAQSRHVAAFGGSSMGKTYSIMQWLDRRARENDGRQIRVVGQDVPNLKDGPIKDLRNYLMLNPDLKEGTNYNKSDKLMTYANGSSIIFKSYDDAQDAHSGRFHDTFFNEANGIDFEIVRQCVLRTQMGKDLEGQNFYPSQCFYDWNPSMDFWADDWLLPGYMGEVDVIQGNYKMNPFLSEEQVKNIEMLKRDPWLWRVYGLGLKGRLQGLVYGHFEEVAEIPKDAKIRAYGLDFGFHDSTALVALYEFDGGIYVDELLYKSQMTPSDIVEAVSGLELDNSVKVWADSANPGTITDIRRLGKVNIIGTKKPKEGKKRDAMRLRSVPLFFTKRSRNLIREASQKQWEQTKKGNEIPDGNDHALDAMIYGFRGGWRGANFGLNK